MSDQENQQMHKIYYRFAFDPQDYTLSFRTNKGIQLQLIKSLLILIHGIEQAAMCVLEIASLNTPNVLLPFDAEVFIGSKLIVYRKPITEYRNALKNIIQCFSGDASQQNNVNLQKLGITSKELDDIIQDNSGTSKEALINDLRQRFMIGAEGMQAVQQQPESYVYQRAYGCRARQKKRPDVNPKDINYDDDSDLEQEQAQNTQELAKKLYDKDTPLGKWLSAGKPFK